MQSHNRVSATKRLPLAQNNLTNCAKMFLRIQIAIK